jgi:hypothetical protein
MDANDRGQKRPLTTPQITPRSDPDLTAIIEAWDRLPEALNAGILAMVRASRG